MVSSFQRHQIAFRDPDKSLITNAIVTRIVVNTVHEFGKKTLGDQLNFDPLSMLHCFWQVLQCFIDIVFLEHWWAIRRRSYKVASRGYFSSTACTVLQIVSSFFDYAISISTKDRLFLVILSPSHYTLPAGSNISPFEANCDNDNQ